METVACCKSGGRALGVRMGAVPGASACYPGVDSVQVKDLLAILYSRLFLLSLPLVSLSSDRHRRSAVQLWPVGCVVVPERLALRLRGWLGQGAACAVVQHRFQGGRSGRCCCLQTCPWVMPWL